MTKQASIQDRTGQRVYVGLDVSLKSWRLKILADGVDRKPFAHNPSPEQLATHLRRNYPGAEFLAGYEAGCTGFWTAHRLNELGIKCVVFHAADIPTTDKERRHKTDSRDCIKIAQALRDDHLTTIHVPSAVTVEDRQLVRMRSTFVGNQTRIKNRIKALLAMHGLSSDDAPVNHRWSGAYIAWLASLVPDRQSLQQVFEAHLEDLAHVRTKIARATLQIRTLAQTERYEHNVALVDSVPGFDVVGAMILLTEIEDIRHFKTVDHLVSFVGFTPSTYSSGESERVGRMTPRARRQLRALFTEAAWVAQRRDPELNAVYTALCVRMPKNRAIIRIARKLVSRVHHVLRTGELYRFENARQTLDEQRIVNEHLKSEDTPS